MPKFIDNYKLETIENLSIDGSKYFLIQWNILSANKTDQEIFSSWNALNSSPNLIPNQPSQKTHLYQIKTFLTSSPTKVSNLDYF